MIKFFERIIGIYKQPRKRLNLRLSKKITNFFSGRELLKEVDRGQFKTNLSREF